MAAVVQHLPQGRFQLLPGIRQGEAQGGAAVDGLHRRRQGQFLRQPGDILLPVGQLPPGKRGDACLLHHLLGDGLVHGHAGPQVPGTGIGYPQQVEGRLDAPVLAALAVEPQEHRVRQAADLQYAGAEKAGGPVPPGRPDYRQVGSPGGDLLLGTQTIWGVKNILPLPFPSLQAQEHVYQDRAVPQAPQCAADPLPGYQGYLALRGQAAGQYDNIQIRFLSVLVLIAPPLPGQLLMSSRSKAHLRYRVEIFVPPGTQQRT